MAFPETLQTNRVVTATFGEGRRDAMSITQGDLAGAADILDPQTAGANATRIPPPSRETPDPDASTIRSDCTYSEPLAISTTPCKMPSG